MINFFTGTQFFQGTVINNLNCIQDEFLMAGLCN